MPGACGDAPVWGTDYFLPDLYEKSLLLPKDIAHAATEAHPCERWAATLNASVLVVKNVAQARRLILEALNLRGKTVAVEANASVDVVNAVKRHGAQIQFRMLEQAFGQDETRGFGLGVDAAWMQTQSGAWIQPASSSPIPVVADCSNSLPIANPSLSADVTLYGMHLSADETQAGALLVFSKRGEWLRNAIGIRMSESDLPCCEKSVAQHERWFGADRLAQKQLQVLHEIRRGLHEAAGLPMNDEQQVFLPHGVAVRIPEECEVSTFVMYLRAENTPSKWAPEIRPLHYAAIDTQRESAERLARWVLIPASPFFTEKEIRGAVLGMVKTAEYLGVRWYTDTTRAVEYAALMNEMYGEGHDAYRPIFLPVQMELRIN